MFDPAIVVNTSKYSRDEAKSELVLPSKWNANINPKPPDSQGRML